MRHDPSFAFVSYAPPEIVVPSLLSLKTEFANVVSFLIALFSIFNFWMFYFYGDVSWMTTNVLMIVFQCSYDIFLYHSHDSVIHHCFVLMIAYLLTFDLEEKDFHTIVLPLLSTEISTLFMILRLWFEKFNMKMTTVYALNNVAFGVSFYVTRIYGFYVNLIANPVTYKVISRYTKGFDSYIVYVGLFGLCALNYYWFVLIIRIVLKFLSKLREIDYDFKYFFYAKHYYILVYFYYIGDMTVFSEMFFVTATCFTALYACFQGSILTFGDGLNDIYNSSIVMLPIHFDVILSVFSFQDLNTINLVIICWVMLLTYLMKPLYLLNGSFIWILFIWETIFLLGSKNN